MKDWLERATDTQADQPLVPPIELEQLGRGQSAAPPASDPVIRHIHDHLWDLPQPPVAWIARRTHGAAFVYGETTTGWAVIAKYYALKTGDRAISSARQELKCIQRARAAGLADGPYQAIRPLGEWRGILFLSFVGGETLAEVIARRRSDYVRFMGCFDRVTRLLAALHRQGILPDDGTDIERPVRRGLQYVDELEAHGVLGGRRTMTDELRGLLQGRAHDPVMRQFLPGLIHGDATTTNFVFPTDDTLVAIDWERMRVGDPAFDMGRLAAEVAHDILRQGGDAREVDTLVGHMTDRYLEERPVERRGDAFGARLRFYRAISMLRISRNGWLARAERLALIRAAMELLSSP